MCPNCVQMYFLKKPIRDVPLDLMGGWGGGCGLEGFRGEKRVFTDVLKKSLFKIQIEKSLSIRLLGKKVCSMIFAIICVYNLKIKKMCMSVLEKKLKIPNFVLIRIEKKALWEKNLDPHTVRSDGLSLIVH